MSFTVLYPVYFISKEDDVALAQVRHESGLGTAQALPLFTDDEGAIDFRDQHFPGWSLGMCPDEAHLARLLAALRSRLSLVVVDPYKLGTRPATFVLDELLAQMSR